MTLGHGKSGPRLFESLLTSQSFTIFYKVSSEHQEWHPYHSRFDAPSLYLETWLAQGERVMSRIKSSCPGCNLRVMWLGKQVKDAINSFSELLLSVITIRSARCSLFICSRPSRSWWCIWNTLVLDKGSKGVGTSQPGWHARIRIARASPVKDPSQNLSTEFH